MLQPKRLSEATYVTRGRASRSPGSAISLINLPAQAHPHGQLLPAPATYTGTDRKSDCAFFFSSSLGVTRLGGLLVLYMTCSLAVFFF